MQIIVKREPSSALLISVLLGICFVIVTLEMVVTIPHSKIILYGFFAVFATGYSFFRCKSKRDYLSLFLCLFSSAILYLVGRTVIFFLILMFAQAIRGNSFRKNAKIMFWAQAILFLFILFLFVAFRFNYELSLFPLEGSSRRIRYSLGFNHPNGAASYYFFLLLCFYLYHPLSWKNSLVTLPTSFCIFWLTDSRTFLISLVFLYLVLLAHRLAKGRFKLVYRIDMILFPALTVATILLSLLYHNSFVDGLVSGRLTNTYVAFTGFSIPILAQTNPLPILDNLFAFSLLNKGAIVWTCCAGFLGMGLVRAKKGYASTDFSKLAFCYFALMFYSMSEALILYTLNPVVSLIAVCAISNHRERDITLSLALSAFSIAPLSSRRTSS